MEPVKNNRPEVLCKKSVLRNFTKCTGKQNLCQCLIFNEAARLRPAALLKRDPVNFVKFLRTPFFIEHFLWLPLIQLQFFVILLSGHISIKHLRVPVDI